MPNCYDLHSHSTASDGTLSPNELVRMAAAFGIYGLALTDHDTVDGLAPAMLEAIQAGIVLIPGVEISVTWHGQTIHIVGLHINPACPQLQVGLEELRKFRAWRAQEIGRRLATSNIHNAFEGARDLSNGHVIGRTHFARFLVQQGFAKNEHQVFKHFMKRGKPGHVPTQWATLNAAIDWIRQAGGQAVLAHPARYKLTHSKLRDMIKNFRDMGGCAIEVISSSHNYEDCLTIASIAKKFELLSSVGSDFHDPHTARLQLGQLPKLPAGCVPIWHNWNELYPTAAYHSQQ